MVFASRKTKETQSAAAEVIGGRVGWPTESWLKGKRLFVFSPFGQLGSKSQPISGEAGGRSWTSFRISSMASRSALTSTMTRTWRHTAIVFPEIVGGLPVFSIISRLGGWEKLGLGRKTSFATGDSAFDGQVLVAAAAANQQRVLELLTDDVKAAVRGVIAIDRGAFVKIAGDTDMLMCWVNGEDARDDHFPPLLNSLAYLADSIEAAAGALRRTA
jgi:hypothetical protein